MIRLNAEAERTKNYARAADLYFERSARSTNSLTILFRTSWRAGHFAISSWLDFRCCFQSSSGFRLALSRVAAVLLAMLFLVSPALCKQSRRLRCSPCLFPCPFLESAFALPSPRFFCTVCCRLCATLRPVLQDIPRSLRESAVALGLSPIARLWEVYLPMASRSILSGIKTSAVINIGTATLAALIGAGGLGEPIISGLNLNDRVTILEGAIPAAVLALLVQWCFDLLDRVLIPKGLRI